MIALVIFRNILLPWSHFHKTVFPVHEHRVHKNCMIHLFYHIFPKTVKLSKHLTANALCVMTNTNFHISLLRFSLCIRVGVGFHD